MTPREHITGVSTGIDIRPMDTIQPQPQPELEEPLQMCGDRHSWEDIEGCHACREYICAAFAELPDEVDPCIALLRKGHCCLQQTEVSYLRLMLEFVIRYGGEGKRD